MLKVCEIFTSIQGESSYAGQLFQFIRLTGCNLRCEYCDTVYAYEEGTEMAVDEIVAKIKTVPVHHVLITGGEPLLQSETSKLASALIQTGHTVLIETNGSQDIGQLPEGAIRILDFKCPSSGESESNRYENIDFLTNQDEVKFVIGDRADYDWAKRIMSQYDLPGRCAVLFSPVFFKIEPRELAEWMIEERVDARFNLQLHKLVWPENKRGV